MNVLELFAGAGGGILGHKILGHRTVCAVEIDEYARSVLVARQNDGTLDPFPIWDDVRTFDGRPWRGVVDVVSGGFPCQDISIAGKGCGIDGARSGLWKEMARIVSEVRPRYVFVENSPMLVRRGLTRVIGDLAKMGYDAVWGVLGADDVGAPHRRKRLWILAYADGERQLQQTEEWNEKRMGAGDCRKDVPYSDGIRQERRKGNAEGDETWGKIERHSPAEGWWSVEPDVGRVAYGVAFRMDRLEALGNGQVPIVAASAFRKLLEIAKEHQ